MRSTKPRKKGRAKGSVLKTKQVSKLTTALPAIEGNRRKWYTVELSPQGEGEPISSLLSSLKNFEPEIDVFVPANIYRNSDNVEIADYLYPGYIFIRSTSVRNPASLINIPFVKQILTASKGYATIDEGEIERIRRQLRKHNSTDLKVGDKVKITVGLYANLTGEITSAERGSDSVKVKFQFKSIMTEAKIPKFIIEKV